MKQPKENSEFRAVRAARECLTKYIESGRDVAVIKATNNIDRFDVWQCVFEKEPLGYRELQIKELYQTCLKDRGDLAVELVASLYITILTQFVEFKTPLSLSDGIKVMVDSLGEESIDALIEEAKVFLDRRVEISSKYTLKDNEWVDYSKKVYNALKKLKK